jgi:hypothetical protein
MSERRSTFYMYALMIVWALVCGLCEIFIFRSFKESIIVVGGYTMVYASWFLGTSAKKDT